MRVRVLNLAFGATGAEHPFTTLVHGELVLRPVSHAPDSRVRLKLSAFLPVVKDGDFDLATPVTVQDFRPMRVAVGDLLVLMRLLLGVVGKNRKEFGFIMGVGLLSPEARQYGGNRLVVPDLDWVRPVSVLDLDIDFVFVIHENLDSKVAIRVSSGPDERVFRRH